MDREEIKKEIEGILYLYKMRDVIRYDENRKEKIKTESVPEHIYGMMILANHFMYSGILKEDLDREKIYRMILFHDIDEMEKGDMPIFKKTDKDRFEARATLPYIYRNLPNSISKDIEDIFDEVENGITREAIFVKILDKIEPLFSLYFSGENNVSEMYKRAGISITYHTDRLIGKASSFPTIEDYVVVMSEMFLEKYG